MDQLWKISILAVWKLDGAFHLSKNSGFNFRNFCMSNARVFSNMPNQSCFIPRACFPPRITQKNAEGLWWSGCKCLKLLHEKRFNRHSELLMKQTFPWYLPDRPAHLSTCDLRTLQSFLANRVNWPTGHLERPVHYVFVEDRQSRTGSTCGRSICIQWSVDWLPSCSFGRSKIRN